MRQSRHALLAAVFCLPFLGQEGTAQEPAFRSIRAAMTAAGLETFAGGKCGTPAVMAANHYLREHASLRSLYRRSTGPGTAYHTSRLSPSGHFRIFYDTTVVAGTDNVPALLNSSGVPMANTFTAFVDSVAMFADLVWRTEVDSLGYAPPPADGTAGGGPEYDIYIRSLDPGVFGYTEWDPSFPVASTPAERFATWLTIDNDFAGLRTLGMKALKVTLAHEFFHAIQVGAYGIWSTSDFFYFELSSSWMEDIVFTEVNDYWLDLPVYFRSYTAGLRPESFTAYNGSFPGYERCIWNHFLARRYGAGMVRQIWERIGIKAPLPAMEAVLQESGTSLKREYAEFSRWNLHTGLRADVINFYPEGDHYPTLAPNQSVPLASGSAMVSSSYPSMSSGSYAFFTGTDTVRVVVTNTNIPDAIARGGSMESFDLRLLVPSISLATERLTNGYGIRFSPSVPKNWSQVFYSDSLGREIASTSVSGPTANSMVAPNPWRMSEGWSLVVTLNATTIHPVTLRFFTPSMDLAATLEVPVLSVDGTSKVAVTPGAAGALVSGVYFLSLNNSDFDQLVKLAVVR